MGDTVERALLVFLQHEPRYALGQAAPAKSWWAAQAGCSLDAVLCVFAKAAKERASKGGLDSLCFSLLAACERFFGGTKERWAEGRRYVCLRRDEDLDDQPAFLLVDRRHIRDAILPRHRYAHVVLEHARICSHAFRVEGGEPVYDNDTTLVSLWGPNLLVLNADVCFWCSRLSTLVLPSLLVVGGSALERCESLQVLHLPSATSLKMGACYGCITLSWTTMPRITTVEGYAFENCSSLEHVDLPTVTRLSQYAFRACANLSIANLPLLTDLEPSAFDQCRRLSTLHVPPFALANCPDLAARLLPDPLGLS